MSTTSTRAKKSSKSPPRKAPLPLGAGHHERPDAGTAFLREPTEARPEMHSSEGLAEMLGEEYLRAATSGEDTYLDDIDVVATEELGGPFLTTSAREEVSQEEESAPANSTREPFPRSHHTPLRSQ